MSCYDGGQAGRMKRRESVWLVDGGQAGRMKRRECVWL